MLWRHLDIFIKFSKVMWKKFEAKLLVLLETRKGPFINTVTAKMQNFTPPSPYVTVSHFFHYTFPHVTKKIVTYFVQLICNEPRTCLKIFKIFIQVKFALQRLHFFFVVKQRPLFYKLKETKELLFTAFWEKYI